MPILAMEPQLYPSQLLQMEDSVFLQDRSWWVLHTKPRQEKSLARSLHAAEIAYYLPLTQRRIYVRDRMQMSHIPLFAGYVFLLANYEERIAALETCRVVSSIPVKDQARLLQDLVQIERLISLGATVRAEERMIPGVTVEIQSGPLAGLCGKIVQESSRQRFFVAVDFIHRGASILLDSFTLLPVHE